MAASGPAAGVARVIVAVYFTIQAVLFGAVLRMRLRGRRLTRRQLRRWAWAGAAAAPLALAGLLARPDGVPYALGRAGAFLALITLALLCDLYFGRG